MARTVHHTPLAYRAADCDNHDCARNRTGRYIGINGYLNVGADCDYTGPQHALTDLRYSTLDRVRAERTGTRPVPSRLRHRMPEHMAFERLYGSSGEIHNWADLIEGRARTRISRDLRDAVGVVNAALQAGDEDAYEAADDLDFAPAAHRNSARWEAL